MGLKELRGKILKKQQLAFSTSSVLWFSFSVVDPLVFTNY
jgi:hypothetical protein